MSKLTDKTTIECQQENPKKRASKAFERYEKYKVAKTVREALQLGAGIGDLKHDQSKGFMKAFDETGNVIPPEPQGKKDAAGNPVPATPKKNAAPATPNANAAPPMHGPASSSNAASSSHGAPAGAGPAHPNFSLGHHSQCLAPNPRASISKARESLEANPETSAAKRQKMIAAPIPMDRRLLSPPRLRAASPQPHQFDFLQAAPGGSPVRAAASPQGRLNILRPDLYQAVQIAEAEVKEKAAKAEEAVENAKVANALFKKAQAEERQHGFQSEASRRPEAKQEAGKVEGAARIPTEWKVLQKQICDLYPQVIKTMSKEESAEFHRHCLTMKMNVMGLSGGEVPILEKLEKLDREFIEEAASLKAIGKTDKEVEASFRQMASSFGAALIKGQGQGEAVKFLLAIPGKIGSNTIGNNAGLSHRMVLQQLKEIATQGKAGGKSQLEIQTVQDEFAMALVAEHIIASKRKGNMGSAVQAKHKGAEDAFQELTNHAKEAFAQAALGKGKGKGKGGTAEFLDATFALLAKVSGGSTQGLQHVKSTLAQNAANLKRMGKTDEEIQVAQDQLAIEAARDMIKHHSKGQVAGLLYSSLAKLMTAMGVNDNLIQAEVSAISHHVEGLARKGEGKGKTPEEIKAGQNEVAMVILAQIIRAHVPVLVSKPDPATQAHQGVSLSPRLPVSMAGHDLPGPVQAAVAKDPVLAAALGEAKAKVDEEEAQLKAWREAKATAKANVEAGEKAKAGEEAIAKAKAEEAAVEAAVEEAKAEEIEEIDALERLLQADRQELVDEKNRIEEEEQRLQAKKQHLEAELEKAKAKEEAEAKAKAEEEVVEKAKAEEEAAAKAKAEEEAVKKAKAEEEVAAKAKAEDEAVEKAKAEEEAAAKAKAEEEAVEKAEAAAKAQAEEEAVAKAKAEEEAAAKAKAEEEVVEKAKAEEEAAAKAQAEEEAIAKAKAEEEAAAKAKAEEEAVAKAKAEEEALAKAKAEEEAVEKAKAEEEAAAKAKAEEEAVEKAEAEEEAAAKAKAEEEAVEKAKAEEEAAAKAKAEDQAVEKAKAEEEAAAKGKAEAEEEAV